jgi:hypothetical protein
VPPAAATQLLSLTGTGGVQHPGGGVAGVVGGASRVGVSGGGGGSRRRQRLRGAHLLSGEVLPRPGFPLSGELKYRVARRV